MIVQCLLWAEDCWKGCTGLGSLHCVHFTGQATGERTQVSGANDSFFPTLQLRPWINGLLVTFKRMGFPTKTTHSCHFQLMCQQCYQARIVSLGTPNHGGVQGDSCKMELFFQFFFLDQESEFYICLSMCCRHLLAFWALWGQRRHGILLGKTELTQSDGSVQYGLIPKAGHLALSSSVEIIAKPLGGLTLWLQHIFSGQISLSQ